MINFLLDDWMPWHKHDSEFSTLDILHPLMGIQGPTRELVVALTLQSQVQRAGFPPGQTCASSSDNVKGFIACLREQLDDDSDHNNFWNIHKNFQ